MSIVWFDDESKQSNDLPWIKEYIADGGTGDIPTVVWSCYICPTGILVITEWWKGFVYGRAKAHTQLSEALEAYISYTEPLPRLVVRSSDSGKLGFGLDKSEVDAVWVRHGKEYAQMFGESAVEFGEFKERKLPNPLLPPSPRTNGARKAPKGEPKRNSPASPL